MGMVATQEHNRSPHSPYRLSLALHIEREREHDYIIPLHECITAVGE